MSQHWFKVLQCSAILWLPELIAAVQVNVAMLFNLIRDKIKEKVPLSLMTGLLVFLQEGALSDMDVASDLNQTSQTNGSDE